MGEGNPWRIDAYRKPATTHRRGVPKPVRPFPLISYYWEPSRFPSERNCHGIQHPRKRCGLPLPLPDAGYRAHQGNPFSLDGGIPAWTVEGDDLAKVNDFLKKSCMEFCGSLPGDDKGEDGYSLTGEARDAATSRNGLNENRKSVAEMIQECFDSIENSGDAI